MLPLPSKLKNIDDNVQFKAEIRQTCVFIIMAASQQLKQASSYSTCTFFAEVKITARPASDVSERVDGNYFKSEKRRPFLKVVYPNGVHLVLPVGVDVELLEKYIRIKL